MVVEELDTHSEAAWDTDVDAHPRSTCYPLAAWRSVAQSAHRLRAPFPVARESAVLGVLPLFRVPGPVEGHLTCGLYEHPHQKGASVSRSARQWRRLPRPIADAVGPFASRRRLA